MSFLHVLRAPLRWMRGAYDWMLRFADKPYAEKALFGLSFAEASFFPIPPDPLLLAMGAGRPPRALRYALVTTFGSVAGAVLGYWIGTSLMQWIGDPIVDFYHLREKWEGVKESYNREGVKILFTAALTPIPFKLFTIAGGAAGQELLPFLGAAAVGRSLRFFAEGFLLRRFGAPIVAWIDKWFNLAAILFTVLLVGGFMVVKYL